MEQKTREGRVNLRDSLDRISERLAKAKSMRSGYIVFHLEGAEGGHYTLECGEGRVKVAGSAAAGIGVPPLIEVIGDGRRIRAILAGEKDAVEQFIAGGFRVRGDLRYLSDIALELGLIKQPL